MKIAIIILGLMRSFDINYQQITKYFCNYDYDIFICTSKYTEESVYLFKNNIIPHMYPKIKNILYVDDSIEPLLHEQHNLSKQWFKTKLILSVLENYKYDMFIKTRPDLHILSGVFDASVMKTGMSVTCNQNGITDQFMVFTPNVMPIIKSIYDNLERLAVNYNVPLVSENILECMLKENKIPLHVISVDYKLILSHCNIIAICGDSGSGKSTLCNIIKPLLHLNNLLTLETDRYHKWERGNKNYETYTHLHPYANHLEKMAEDVYHLKIGDNIYTVDYDHKTGSFSPVEKITTANNIILCGLHTLFVDKINTYLDLKVYIDTDRSLIKKWKIERDVNERGHCIDKVLDSINKRAQDYEDYIHTQKNNANVIIRYFLDQNNNIKLHVKLESIFLSKIDQLCKDNNVTIDVNWINIHVIKDYDKNDVKNIINTKIFINDNDIYDGYSGFLQLLLFYLIYF